MNNQHINNTLNQALNLHQTGQLNAAKTLYQEILKQQPTHSDALNLLGVIKLEEKQYDNAIELIKKAIQYNPNIADYYNNLGLALKKIAKFNEAIANYQQAIKLKPDYRQPYINLIQIFKEQGQTEALLTIYQQLAELNSNTSEFYFRFANLLQQSNKIEQAILNYQKAIVINPNYPECYNNMAVALLANQQLEQALNTCQHAIKLKPNYSDAYNNLSAIYLKQNDLENAIKTCEKLIKIQPNNEKYYNNLAYLLKQQGKLEPVIAIYQKSIEACPNNKEAYDNLVKIYQQQNKPLNAIAVYQALQKINPDDYVIYCLIADLFAKSGYLDDAILNYRKATELKSDDVEIYNNLAVLLYKKNNIDDAIKLYEKIIKIDSSYSSAYHNLAAVYQKKSEFEQAIENYKLAIVYNPNLLISYTALIGVQKDENQIKEAEKTLEEALTLFPDNLELQFKKLSLTLPVVVTNETESSLVPIQFDAQLTELESWFHENPERKKEISNFFNLPSMFNLAYRVGNHKERLSRYGDLLMMPDEQTALVIPRVKTKLKIIIISNHFHSHSVWHIITRGLLANLNKDKFELVLCYTDTKENSDTEFAKSLADKWIDSQQKFDISVLINELKQEKADIIFYPEIGMDTVTNKLATYRLAPLQVASWGHPITTGLATIDLYFSGELIEPENAQSHYRERLICLPNTGCCTILNPRNIMPLNKETIDELNKHQGIRFIIAQTVYKFDPADDSLYANIAQAVPDSIFILLRDQKRNNAKNQVFNRLKTLFEKHGLNAERLVLLPWQTGGRFPSLLDVSDIYLDCLSFSGYTTARQALYQGLPIITLEGEFMRQRLAAGLLRRIGMTDTIVHTREDYVKCAVKLAQECLNQEFKTARREALKSAAYKIDNDISVVRAFEYTLITSWQTLQRGESLQNMVVNFNEIKNQTPVIDINKTLKTAIAYHQAGQLSDAQALYEKVLDIEAYHPDTLNLLGVIMMQNKEYDKAIDLIQKAIKSNPIIAGYYNNLGMAFKNKGDIDAAIKNYQQALKIKPNYAEAYSNLAEIFSEQNKSE